MIGEASYVSIKDDSMKILPLVLGVVLGGVRSIGKLALTPWPLVNELAVEESDM